MCVNLNDFSFVKNCGVKIVLMGGECVNYNNFSFYEHIYVFLFN